MRFLVLAVRFVPFFVTAAPACSSSSSANMCKVYDPPSDFVATTPAVSFKTDVAPIFQKSCAFSSCHGNENGGNQANLYLGDDKAKIFTNLVGFTATKYPQMPRIAANDAKNSYLMHKIDGDSCTLPSCSGACANTMPDDTAIDQSPSLLTVAQRDTFRRWILQGAQNN